MKVPNKTILTIILTAVFVLLLYTVVVLLLREPQVLLPEVLPTGELTEEKLVVQVEQKEPIGLNIPDELLKIIDLGNNRVSMDGWPMDIKHVATHKRKWFGSNEVDLYCIVVLITDIPSLRQIDVCFPDDERARDENRRNLEYLINRGE